jgi:hypothetical protein
MRARYELVKLALKEIKRNQETRLFPGAHPLDIVYL